MIRIDIDRLFNRATDIKMPKQRTATVTLTRNGKSTTVVLNDALEVRTSQLMLASAIRKQHSNVKTIEIKPIDWSNKDGGTASANILTSKGLQLTYRVAVHVLDPA